MSINKVILVGRLGKDPELKYNPKGMAFCNFSVATSESWTDKSTGKKNEKTEWHNCTAFQNTAENIAKYLKKGSQVYIEGRLQTDKAEKNGVDLYYTKIIVQTAQFLDANKDKGQPEEHKQFPVSKNTASKNDFFTADDIPF